MGTRDLDYSDTVKYPGVLLDNKLTFGPHFREKAKKSISSYINIGPQRGSCGAQLISDEMGPHWNFMPQGYVWCHSLGH